MKTTLCVLLSFLSTTIMSAQTWNPTEAKRIISQFHERELLSETGRNEMYQQLENRYLYPLGEDSFFNDVPVFFFSIIWALHLNKAYTIAMESS